MPADLSALRNRPLRRIFLARTISVAGNGIAPIGLSFGILGLRHGSGTLLGAVLAVNLTSQVVFLPYGGVLADRFSRQRVMALADLGAGLAQAAIAVLFLTRSAQPAALAALAAGSGAAASLFTPASRAVVTDFAGRDQLQSVNALLRLSTTVAGIGGSAVAGGLVALVGPGWTLMADALSFALSATLLVAVRGGHAAVAATQSARLLANLREGWREFASRRWLWAMSAQSGCLNICICGWTVLGPVVAAARLGGAPAWAAILACQATGFALGSVVAMRLRPRHPLKVSALITAGFIPVFVSLAWAGSVLIVAAAALLNGAVFSIYEVLLQTAMQQHIPPDALSRVLSFDSFSSFVLAPVALVVAAPIADGAGMNATLTGAGVLIGLSGVLVLALPSVRLLTGSPAVPAAPVAPAADPAAAGESANPHLIL